MLPQASAGIAEPYGSTNKSASFHVAASFNSAMPAKTTSRSSSAFSSPSRETGWLATVGNPSCQNTKVLAASVVLHASRKKDSNANLRINASQEFELRSFLPRTQRDAPRSSFATLRSDFYRVYSH